MQSTLSYEDYRCLFVLAVAHNAEDAISSCMPDLTVCPTCGGSHWTHRKDCELYGSLTEGIKEFLSDNPKTIALHHDGGSVIVAQNPALNSIALKFNTVDGTQVTAVLDHDRLKTLLEEKTQIQPRAGLVITVMVIVAAVMIGLIFGYGFGVGL